MGGHVMLATQPKIQKTNCWEHRIGVALFAIVTCVSHGCAVFERELVREGLIRLDKVPSDIARLLRVRVYEDNGDLVVYGNVSRKAGVQGRVDAIVRVLLQLPDGRTLEETERAFPPYLPIRRSRKSNFTVRFDGLPPAGTIVRLECPPNTPSTAPASSSVAWFSDREMHL